MVILVREKNWFQSATLIIDRRSLSDLIGIGPGLGFTHFPYPTTPHHPG